jgi:hypothetical protein
MKTIKVAVILPSRGLIFSQTADEIIANLRTIPHKFFFSHRRPIPECFEIPTEQALLDDSITHLWFIEDDMILPPDTLRELIATDKAVVVADYPINKNGRGSVFEVDKQIVFTGTGCMLVKREVFDELRKPYFRTDMRWNIKNYGSFLKLTRIKSGTLDGYGLHDVNFCMNLYNLNIPIHKIDIVLGQRKLLAWGKAGSNDGAHKIEEWTKVKKDHLLKAVKLWPIEKKGSLISVMTPTGEITVSPAHAKKLVKEGLATKMPRRKLVVDWNEE